MAGALSGAAKNFLDAIDAKMTLTFALDSMQETGATVSVSAEAGLDWSSKTAFSSSLQVDMTKEINSIDKAVAAGLSNNQVMVLSIVLSYFLFGRILNALFIYCT